MEQIEDDVNDIFESLSDQILSYIRVTVGIDLKNAMFTSNLQSVRKMLAGHHTVLSGPKGCGKTYIVTMMFCLCWLKGLPDDDVGFLRTLEVGEPLNHINIILHVHIEWSTILYVYSQ